MNRAIASRIGAGRLGSRSCVVGRRGNHSKAKSMRRAGPEVAAGDPNDLAGYRPFHPVFIASRIRRAWSQIGRSVSGAVWRSSVWLPRATFPFPRDQASPESTLTATPARCSPLAPREDRKKTAASTSRGGPTSRRARGLLTPGSDLTTEPADRGPGLGHRLLRGHARLQSRRPFRRSWRKMTQLDRQPRLAWSNPGWARKRGGARCQFLFPPS